MKKQNKKTERLHFYLYYFQQGTNNLPLNPVYIYEKICETSPWIIVFMQVHFITYMIVVGIAFMNNACCAFVSVTCFFFSKQSAMYWRFKIAWYNILRWKTQTEIITNIKCLMDRFSGNFWGNVEIWENL